MKRGPEDGKPQRNIGVRHWVVNPNIRSPFGCGTPRSQLTVPAGEQRVRYPDRVQHLAGHEVDELAGTGPGAGAVEARAGRQHHGYRVVQRDQVLQVRAGHRRLPGYHHHPAALLEVHLGGPLQQVLGEPEGDPGTRGGAGRYHHHAPRRIRAAARPGGQVTGRPVGDFLDHYAEPGFQIVMPVRVPERDAGLVQQGQPGRPGHHQVDREPGVEQPAQDRGGIRGTGRAGHPDDPRGSAFLDLGGRHPSDGVLAARISGCHGCSPSRRTRSARAKTNRTMPTKPLAVKNARLTRDRSSGLTIACSYPNAPAVSKSPIHQSEPSPTRMPYQTKSANVMTCATVEARSAKGTPYRAGTLCTPIRRSTSTSWVA